jgi:diacylglycerol kinase
MKLKWSSFRAAFAGIVFLLRTQVNARWHLVATIATLITGYVLGVSRVEWLALFLAVGFVWIAEAINTAIEQSCDAITMEKHPKIRDAKDVAAGAVLLAGIVAVMIGLFVFVPHFRAKLAEARLSQPEATSKP